MLQAGHRESGPALRSPFYQAPGTPLRPPGRTPDAPLQQRNQRFITWRSPTSPAHSQDVLSHHTEVRHSVPAWGPPCLCTLPSATSSPRQMPRPGSAPIHPSGTTAPRVPDPPLHLGGAQGLSELRMGVLYASRFPHCMRSLNLQLPLHLDDLAFPSLDPSWPGFPPTQHHSMSRLPLSHEAFCISLCAEFLDSLASAAPRALGWLCAWIQARSPPAGLLRGLRI